MTAKSYSRLELEPNGGTPIKSPKRAFPGRKIRLATKVPLEFGQTNPVNNLVSLEVYFQQDAWQPSYVRAKR